MTSKPQKTTPLKIKRTRAILTDEQIADALTKTKGNISAAARLLECDRSTIHSRIVERPSLAVVLSDAREGLVDSAEDALSKLINEGNVAAIIFTLKTQGKRRGWIERQEITGADGETLAVHVNVDSMADLFKAIQRHKDGESGGA